MNQAALDGLTDAICGASLTANMNRRKTRLVTEQTLLLLPSREAAIREGEGKLTARLKTEVRANLKSKGFIRFGVVVSAILILPILWEVVLGVVIALIVRWLIDDMSQARLIQQARAA